MPQPHTASAATSHQHSYSQSQSQAQTRARQQQQLRSTSTSSLARQSSFDPNPARSDSVSHARLDSLINLSAQQIRAPGQSQTQTLSPPAADFHYNRGRSGTAGSSAGTDYSTGGHGGVPSDFRFHQPSRHDHSKDRDPTLYQPPRITGIDAGSRETPPSSPSFFAGTLPRTSSLLPPPRNLGVLPVAGPTGANTHADHDFSFFLDPLTQSLRPFSRGSSTGAVSDSFRNLNRWSASTTSTRASLHTDREPQQTARPPTNFSRRMSVDSAALLNSAVLSPSSAHPPPRKLTKRRPSATSIISASPTSTQARSRSPPPNLPPVISLPLFELSATSLIARDPAPAVNRLSPAVGTPTSTFSSQPGAEPKDYFWDELTDPSLAPISAARVPSPSSPPPATVTRETVMPEKKGHTRSRSPTAKSSTDSGRPKNKQPSQKAMLSKALAKANTAVQLDNAQNYEGARSSYTEACDLLAHVLTRTSGEDDKKKLEAIRRTYTSRIKELDGMVPRQARTDGKALPARPESLAYSGAEVRSNSGDDDGDSDLSLGRRKTESPRPSSAQGRRRSPSTKVVDSGEPQLHSSFSSSRSPLRRNFDGAALTIPTTANGQLMPAPLSPRRPLSPAKPVTPEPAEQHNFFLPAERSIPERTNGHSRVPSHESISWLDPIDESGGSAPSSVHSRTSSFGVRRKHIRAASGDTEAEFDAALDAAVEAAYDDGYESMDTYYNRPYNDGDEEDVVAKALRRVEIAKERVRQTEREAQSEREAVIQNARQRSRDSQTYTGGHFYDGTDSDEEERMLEDLTRDYALSSFTFNQQIQKPAEIATRGRESDSSGLTQQTRQSSLGSSPPTATTVLSSVAELPMQLTKPPTQSLPPPPQSLPQIPGPALSNTASGVRSRRLSGQNPKQLKIETVKISQSTAAPAGTANSTHSKQASFIAQQRQALSATGHKPLSLPARSPSSPTRVGSPAPPTPPRNPPHTDDSDDFRSGSPPPFASALRKNQSSSSLKSLKSRQLSVSNVDNGADLSPHTPLSQVLTNSSLSRQPAVPALPTPIAATFGGKANGGFGGLHLFDSDFHSPRPTSPSTAQNHGSDVPAPLEPCPSDVMLRPFWLMRALYQTLAHPRGGYVTARLFVPRDVWRVKGVKLRALEDKSSQCDLLTAALGKLARVDSTDADAVLEEMQSFETVLEQVQQTLTRKLGNEVGTQGASAFRDREDSEPTPVVPRSASVSGKAAAFSWRRLRSKGSAVNLTSAYGNKSTSGGPGERIPEKEVLCSGTGALSSLPIVAHPSSRPAKRDVTSIVFDGPYAGYMQSLARLFDAAQAVDQIARQVDDPGLRHADKTQVGLELCTRHAAEFFGFYICRFVLADLAMLLDKFVKRGSEWVLT